MAESTKQTSERLRVQSKDEMKKKSDIVIRPEEVTRKTSDIKTKPKDETKKPSDIKIKPKDETRKIPEVKLQPVKSLKELNDSERTKNFISRNVAINRSFNSNSKLELLR